MPLFNKVIKNLNAVFWEKKFITETDLTVTFSNL